jgi:hypothetical protein
MVRQDLYWLLMRARVTYDLLYDEYVDGIIYYSGRNSTYLSKKRPNHLLSLPIYKRFPEELFTRFDINGSFLREEKSLKIYES